MLGKYVVFRITFENWKWLDKNKEPRAVSSADFSTRWLCRYESSSCQAMFVEGSCHTTRSYSQVKNGLGVIKHPRPGLLRCCSGCKASPSSLYSFQPPSRHNDQIRHTRRASRIVICLRKPPLYINSVILWASQPSEPTQCLRFVAASKWGPESCRIPLVALRQSGQRPLNNIDALPGCLNPSKIYSAFNVPSPRKKS